MKNFLRTLPLIGAALFMWTGCGSPEVAEEETSGAPAVPVAKSVQVAVMTLSPEPFTHRFSVQGNVETDRNALLTAEFGGRIEDVFVREGEQVSEGDALVKVDTDVIERSIAELNTQLELAMVVFERQQRLWDQKIGSEIEYLQAKTQLESLQRSMETLNEQKDMAVIRAPFDGVVDRCLAKTGEFAAPGAPLLRIVNLSDMKVRAMVSDHYAGRIDKGMPATVIVTGVDTIETSVGRVGQFINPANRTLEITLPLPERTGFLPNMFASVWLEDLNLDSALVLPSSLIQQDINGDDFVFVAVGKGAERKVEKRVLEMGMGAGNVMLVESGLEFGQDVISKGATRVVAGQLVSIIEE
jgi:RND family efflux transporter MFP subunit